MVFIKTEITTGANFDITVKITVKITQSYYMPSKVITMYLKFNLIFLRSKALYLLCLKR